MNSNISMGLTFILLLAVDLILGIIGLNTKEKIDYNNEIENNAQMNLFKDFNIYRR
jgi:hypothetical protein